MEKEKVKSRWKSKSFGLPRVFVDPPWSHLQIEVMIDNDVMHACIDLGYEVNALVMENPILLPSDQ